MSTDVKQNMNTIQDNGGQGCVIRFRFIKGETVRYISHLDMLNTFQRAMRRAHVPLSYSRGYNPHPSMIFGMALSLGISSECEAVDLGLAEKLPIDEVMDISNRALPMDIQFTSGEYTPPKNSIMAAVYEGEYSMLVTLDGGADALKQAVSMALNSEELTAAKKFKEDVKMVNIRPMILRSDVSGYTDAPVFEAKDHPAIARLSDAWNMAAGNEDPKKLAVINLECTMGAANNLRPDMFLDGLRRNCGVDSIKCVKMHKKHMKLRPIVW